MPRIHYAFCLILSAALLMVVQPMMGRFLLPFLGGSPGVWNTCLFFFQAALLVGYAYAHYGPKWLGVRTHAVVHGVLLASAFVFLPFAVAAPATPPQWPALWTLAALTTTVAFPYVLLAGTSSLAQLWLARTSDADPYPLYAASNLGSFLGLFAYPLWLEPTFTGREQSILWQGGFALLTAMLWIAVASLMRNARSMVPLPPTPRPSARIVARWILLALAPSSLLLSVTLHLTTDITPMPILWLIPFGLYLLTFMAAFSGSLNRSHAVLSRYVPVAILFLIVVWLSEATEPFAVVVVGPLIGFTWLCLSCHGELARTRPAADHLTAFYLWIALGGVLGGAINVLVAPFVFSSHLEYPLMLIAIGALRPTTNNKTGAFASWAQAIGVGVGAFMLVGAGGLLGFPPGPAFQFLLLIPLAASLLIPTPFAYALATALIVAAGLLAPSVHGETIDRRRSFFGVHRVTRDGPLTKLVHGNTVHGIQSADAANEPLAYYHRQSPIGDVIQRLDAAGRLRRVGVVGLGAGALAAYSRPGQHWTFFEIDPDVERIARTRFSYLADARGRVDVVLGDARLSLADGDETFDLLIVDAFGSDSIPTHLLTREAFEVYARRLSPHGLIAFHLSNRYLDLFPVLATMSDGWSAWRSDPQAWTTSTHDERVGRLSSWWGLLARTPEDAADVLTRRWTRLKAPPHFRPWTDDFVNLPAVIRWSGE